jgi:hypothetical protein
MAQEGALKLMGNRITLKIQAAGKNLTPASMTPWITSDNDGDELKEYPPIKPADGFDIAPRSIVTLVTTVQK